MDNVSYFKPASKNPKGIPAVIIFIGMVCLFTLPQLNNVHFDPSPTIWAQVTFIWIAILLFLFVIFTHSKISIPQVVIPICLFGLYLVFQQFFVPITYIGLSYITAIEMLSGILLAITVSTIITHYGIKTFVIFLSIALIISALFQTAIGFIQYNNLFKYFGGIIFYDPLHPTTNIFGHFGQRNHYCHFITWASFGLIYLYHQKIINKYVFVPLLFWFMFSMTIASSRSVFIYFFIADLIALIYLIVNQNKPALRLFIIVLIATISLIGFEYAYPIIQNHLHTSQVASGLDRISSSGGDEFGRRLIEWKKAIITFRQHPLFGAGLFGYAHNSVFLYQLFPNTPLNSGLFTNCHNLVLQLLAETGIIGTLIVVGGIIICLVRIFCRGTTEYIIITFMLGTTLAHSMLEYPLWYTYFLGPFIMFLSIDKPIFTIKNKLLIPFSLPIVVILSYIIIINSITFDKLIDYMDTPDDLATFTQQANELEKILKNNLLLGYHANFVLDNYINPNTPYTTKAFSQQDAIRYEEKFTLFQPYPSNLIKLAKLEWSIGNQDYAKNLVRVAITAYPTYKYSLIYSLHSKQYKILYNLANQIK